MGTGVRFSVARSILRIHDAVFRVERVTVHISLVVRCGVEVPPHEGSSDVDVD